jgi:hypothetical protein
MAEIEGAIGHQFQSLSIVFVGRGLTRSFTLALLFGLHFSVISRSKYIWSIGGHCTGLDSKGDRWSTL